MVSLFTSLAVAEVLTRVLLPRPGFQTIPTQSQIIPHPTRGYSYAPNQPGFTNSWGLRDDPIGPDETVHILAVGDSFTVGGGLAIEEAWPSQLELSINSASASVLAATFVSSFDTGVSVLGSGDIVFNFP